MVKKSEGCTFGLVLEQKVNQVEQSVKDIKSVVEKLDTSLQGKMTDLFNHQSSRIPQSTVTQINTQWKIITTLSAITAAILGGIITKIIL